MKERERYNYQSFAVNGGGAGTRMTMCIIYKRITLENELMFGYHCSILWLKFSRDHRRIMRIPSFSFWDIVWLLWDFLNGFNVFRTHLRSFNNTIFFCSFQFLLLYIIPYIIAYILLYFYVLFSTIYQ